MEKIIELAPDDDIVSIRSRLEWADAKRVLVIVPSKNKALHSLVNMKLLARAADSLNMDFALVSQNAQTRDMANAAYVPVYTNENAARKAGFIGETTEITEPQQTEAPVLRVVDPPAPPRVRIKNRKLVLVIGDGRVKLWQQALAFVLIGILGLALVTSVMALAPSATVTLTPKVDVVSTELTVRADPNADIAAPDVENSLIPARPVQIEITLFDEVDTVATDEAPVDFAAGTVVFFNRTQDEQIIPISTTLRTSSGVPIEFITTQETTIPAGTGATTVTQIIALEPGPDGNVSIGQINRFARPTLGLQARVINEAPTSGGTVRQAGIVTEDDKDRLRSKLRQVIQQRGFEMIQAGLDEQEFVPPESLQVIELDLTFNRFSGDVSETFGGEMRAVVRATAIGSYNANLLGYYALLNEVPDGQAMLTKGQQFSAGGVQDVDNRAVTFPVMARGLIVAEIDKDRVREAIAFMPIGDAQAWLSENMPVVSVPGIEVSPNWLGRLPYFAPRVNVVVNDVELLIVEGEGIAQR